MKKVLVILARGTVLAVVLGILASFSYIAYSLKHEFAAYEDLVSELSNAE